MSAASAGGEIVGVICGPTAAGKSSIALPLVQRTGRAIIVADSRQVYRGFDVGTAKPTVDEQRSVRHFGIDVAEPTERYSAAQWSERSAAILGREHPCPIVVGGTGMYLRALFEGLFDEPDTDPGRRMALLEWLDAQTTDALRTWVKQLDPARADLGRTQLLRAVEVALLSGHRISELHDTRARRPGWRPRYLVVDPGASLHARIEQRLDAMLAGGWLDEVRSLSTLPAEAPAWKSTGYRTLRDVILGELNLREARERILIDTRQYAKRQRTWFRHQLPAESTTRVNPESPDATDIVEAWWESLGA